MDKNCQYCDAPNLEGYFNCRSCGKRASKPKWTPQFVVREDNSWARAIRTDQVNFGTKDINTHIKENQKKKELKANKKLHDSIKWDDKPITVKN